MIVDHTVRLLSISADQRRLEYLEMLHGHVSRLRGRSG